MSVTLDTKDCVKCERKLPIGDFRTSRNACRECERSVNRTWHQEHPDREKQRYAEDPEYHCEKKSRNTGNRKDALREVVRGAKKTPCGDCGQRFPYYVMDFDHVEGEKIGNVSNMVSACVTMDVLLDEIAKCDVVCANCHRMRHGTDYEGV